MTMKDVHGLEIESGDNVVHTTPGDSWGRGQSLRYGTVKSVRDKTCTVTATEIRRHYFHNNTWEDVSKPFNRVCRMEERVMVIARDGHYLLGHHHD